ncbi:hypothetical protein HMPREF1870_01848 [Bacteroidales bacterium KA00344]|nr:hypothetical protein HMPREF1870_01848 [Bacteroidales bacterium KA00344]
MGEAVKGFHIPLTAVSTAYFNYFIMVERFLSADHIPAVRRNVYFCPCYLSLETKAKITKRADTS